MSIISYYFTDLVGDGGGNAYLNSENYSHNLKNTDPVFFPCKGMNY